MIPRLSQIRKATVNDNNNTIILNDYHLNGDSSAFKITHFTIFETLRSLTSETRSPDPFDRQRDLPERLYDLVALQRLTDLKGDQKFCIDEVANAIIDPRLHFIVFDRGWLDDELDHPFVDGMTAAMGLSGVVHDVPKFVFWDMYAGLLCAIKLRQTKYWNIEKVHQAGYTNPPGSKIFTSDTFSSFIILAAGAHLYVHNKFYDVTKRQQLIRMYTAIRQIITDMKYLYFSKAIYEKDKIYDTFHSFFSETPALAQFVLHYLNHFVSDTADYNFTPDKETFYELYNIHESPVYKVFLDAYFMAHADLAQMNIFKSLWPIDVCLFDEMRTWYTYGGRNAMIWLFS